MGAADLQAGGLRLGGAHRASSSGEYWFSDLPALAGAVRKVSGDPKENLRKNRAGQMANSGLKVGVHRTHQVRKWIKLSKRNRVLVG